MEEKYKWKLSDIFQDKEEFNKTKKSMKDDLEKIKAYQGKLCETSENLYEAYFLYEKALEKF